MKALVVFGCVFDCLFAFWLLWSVILALFGVVCILNWHRVVCLACCGFFCARLLRLGLVCVVWSLVALVLARLIRLALGWTGLALAHGLLSFVG